MCLCDFSDVLNLPDYCDVTRNFNVWHVLQFQSFLTFILIGFGKKMYNIIHLIRIAIGMLQGVAILM